MMRLMMVLLVSSVAFLPAMAGEFGETDLPEEGDFSLGFDAVPVLDFALNTVNIMNNTGQGADGLVAYPGGFEQVLTGKIFLSSAMAVRARVAIGHQKSSSESYYDHPKDVADPEVETPREISDKTAFSSTSVLLGGGVEFRRGSTRLQGICGGEALLGIASTSASTDYGWIYGQDEADLGVIADGSERALSSSSGTNVLFGVRGFAGVEYFIASKISLSAEYGWSLSTSKAGRGSVETEQWKVEEAGEGEEAPAGTRVINSDDSAGSGGGVFVGVDNGPDSAFSGGSGALTLNFHF